MKIQDLLGEMDARALDHSFADQLCAMYEEDRETGEFGTTESDYQEAVQYLFGIFADDTQCQFRELEALLDSRRNYAASYGFRRGLYGAFRQCLSGNTEQDGGFYSLVVSGLLMRPGMERNPENYAAIVQCDALDQTITNTLLQEDREYMTSILCAWHNRIYHAALCAFYCGYRAGFSVVNDAEPLTGMEKRGKLLTTAYHLGFAYKMESF